MDQLREVAERNNCSIICIRHFGKGSHDKAMMKGIGSTDFVGIARNQLGLGRRKDGERGFLVVTLKANYNEAEGALFKMTAADARAGERAEERRRGKEGGSTCRSRWAPGQKKKKK